MGVHKVGADAKAKKAYDIPLDEPIFVIRAQDNLSVRILARYRNDAEAAGCSKEFVEGIEEIVQDFTDWRQEHPKLTKVPD